MKLPMLQFPPSIKREENHYISFTGFFFFFPQGKIYNFSALRNSQSDKTGHWKLVNYFMITEIGSGKNPCGKIAIITFCNFHYPNQHSRDDTRLQTKSCVNFPTGMTELMNST